MGEPLFIYASWLKAKRSLLEIVWNDECLNQGEVISKVDEWLKRHIFEFGQSYHIQNGSLESSPIDFIREARYRNARQLVDHMLLKGMFAEEVVTNRSYGETILTTRLLVCGAPEHIGNAERT